MISTRHTHCAAAALTLVAAGCSSSTTAAAKLSLTEYTIAVTAPSVKAGKVTISASNVGGGKHEVVLLAASDLKGFATRDDGSLDEDKIAEAQKMGEVGEIEIGKSGSKSFDLKAGTYTVVCNLVDKNADGSVTSHYAKGMVATFVVR